MWFHGFSVAVMVTTYDDWMEDLLPWLFGFGFGTLVFVTQIFGLPFWQDISPWWRIIPPAVWISFSVLVVVLNEDVNNGYLMSLVSIPSGQWGLGFGAWFFIWLFALILPEK